MKWNKAGLLILMFKLGFHDLPGVHAVPPASLGGLLGQDHTGPAALSLAPAILLLSGFPRFPPASSHLRVTRTFFFVFSWYGLTSVTQGKHIPRVHHVFVLSKSGWGAWGLSQIVYSFLLAPSQSPQCLSQTSPSALRFPAPVPPLLTLGKSFPVLYFRRRSRVIFLAPSLSSEPIFVVIVDAFFCVSRGWGASFPPRLILLPALDLVLWRLLQSLLHQLSPSCPFVSSFLYTFFSVYPIPIILTIQFLFLFQTSCNRSLSIFPVTMVLTI